MCLNTSINSLLSLALLLSLSPLLSYVRAVKIGVVEMSLGGFCSVNSRIAQFDLISDDCFTLEGLSGLLSCETGIFSNFKSNDCSGNSISNLTLETCTASPGNVTSVNLIYQDINVKDLFLFQQGTGSCANKTSVTSSFFIRPPDCQALTF